MATRTAKPSRSPGVSPPEDSRGRRWPGALRGAAPLLIGALALALAVSCATGYAVNAAATAGAAKRDGGPRKESTMIFEPAIGRWPHGRRSDDAVFDFGVRAFFNTGWEVGWVSEDDVFRTWLADGESAAKAALADGQRFDLAIRDVRADRVLRASAATAVLTPLDTLASPPLAAGGSGSGASRWLIQFPPSHVIVALDATEYAGTLAPPGSGFRLVPGQP